MENIFNIKFTFEKKCRDKVILKFSNKQGGDYNVFSYHWQCFVWAAIIGFLRGERRELDSPLADRSFSLSTMQNNGGEKDAKALICLAIAKTGSLDIMKTPEEAIKLINEYANGGFYYLLRMIENGETSFNDLEYVKQEIFGRDYEMNETDEKLILLDSDSTNVDDDNSEYGSNNDDSSVDLGFTIENTAIRCAIKDANGDRVFIDEGKLKIIRKTPYRFNWKRQCMTIKAVIRYGEKWIKGDSLFVIYNNSDLYNILSEETYIEKIEDIEIGTSVSANRIKVQGHWFDNNGNIVPQEFVDQSEARESVNEAKTYTEPQSTSDPNEEIRTRRWNSKERRDLGVFFKQGLSVQQLAAYFNRREEEITDVLKKLKLV